MKRIAKTLILIVLVLSLALVPLTVIAEPIASYGIPIVIEFKFYITYYGGPLDPGGNGTTYLAGTEPDWILHDDGTWEIIPSQ